MTEQSKPPIDSVWQECDNRFVRHVRVVGYDGEKVLIVSCAQNGHYYEGANKTKASPARFNGKSGGYRLVSR